VRTKRRHDRRRTRVAARVTEEGVDGAISGITRDISRGGIFIQTRKPLPPGSQVRIELLHKEKPATRLEGVVIHAARVPPHLHNLQPSGMGVRLDEPEASSAGADGEPARDTRVPSSNEVMVFFGSERHLLSIHDLSASGAALVSPTPLPDITFVRMHFKLSDSADVLVVDGVPVRSKPEGSGTSIAVKFLDPPDEVVGLIDDFVRERTRGPDDD